MKPTLFAALLCALATLLQTELCEAIPRFSVREGLPCRACHVNPSGGGMRNRYGRYSYAPTKLPLVPGAGGPLALPDFDISDALALGADARFAFIDQEPPGDSDTPVRSVAQMQADLYVAANLANGLWLYYDQGAYGSFEAFALYQRDFAGGFAGAYLKAGRYMPSYGLRLENHKLFVREEIGFGPGDKDQGLEAGVSVGPVLLQGGIVSGAGPERFLDDNRSPGAVGRIEALWRLGPVRLMAGGSIYYNKAGDHTEVDGTVFDNVTVQRRYAGFWGASLGRRVTYLGELDLVKNEPYPENEEDAKENSFRSYQELDVLLLRGLELNLNYEFREPDLDLSSGSAHRVGVGFEVHPLPHLELKTLFRHTFGSGKVESAVDGFNEAIGMIHIYL